jgi:cation diffusion facilitator CzcD-associated flavoprotein CzcO
MTWAISSGCAHRPSGMRSSTRSDAEAVDALADDCFAEFGQVDLLVNNAGVFQGGLCWERSVADWMGNQHTPRYPNVPAINEFQGASFHGTRWDHSVELTGKRVVVVGSAASAVQIVPEVAKVAGELTVLQRSPNWIMPRRRKFYTDAQRDRWRRFPVIMKAIRRVQQFLMSMVHEAATLGHNRAKQFEKRARAFINDAIPDPQLRAALTPADPYGCKRGLVSDDFYPALMRENVELIPEGLRAVRPTGITTENGREIDADVIIFCTGYRILDYDRITIVGATGQSLADAMSTSTEAFKGIAVPDFPNYFFAGRPQRSAAGRALFRNRRMQYRDDRRVAARQTGGRGALTGGQAGGQHGLQQAAGGTVPAVFLGAAVVQRVDDHVVVEALAGSGLQPPEAVVLVVRAGDAGVHGDVRIEAERR